VSGTVARFAAVDCGAESGRVMVVGLGSDGIQLKEVARFPIRKVTEGAYLRWDWADLSQQVVDGVAAACQRFPDIISVAVDTWGVDYGLLDGDGHLLEAPICYRDPRGLRGQARLDSIMPASERFSRSGIAQLPINTLDQLAADAAERPELLARARRLVFLPDLLAHALGADLHCERSIAATSSCYRAGTGAVDAKLLQSVGVDPALLAPVIGSGNVIGRLAGGGPAIVASAGHDTAAAVAAMPSAAEGSAYCSCGTWSLLGQVVEQPVLGAAAFDGGLANEAHWDGRQRLNRNVMGLWILQECRRAWGGPAYAELVSQAHQSAYGDALPVDDQRLLAAGSDENPMPERVLACLAEAGAPKPRDIQAIVRSILLGLAESYARSLQALAQCSAQPIDELVVLGGGGRNKLLLEFTAERAGIPVRCGAAEATALGNAMIQAVAMGELHAADLPAVAALAGQELTTV
jgi:rhamnulokinase